MPEGEQTSVVIAQEIAAVEGTDPMELEPLYGAVDTDALDALFRNSDAPDLTVEFSYGGHTVRVEGPGQVEILTKGQHTGGSVPVCSD